MLLHIISRAAANQEASHALWFLMEPLLFGSEVKKRPLRKDLSIISWFFF